jgi:hypothetical protein
MKLKTNLKAGALTFNHNQSTGLKLKTSVKAGALTFNHNQSAR